MSLKLPYVTLDVFTTKPFSGNQLAIVTIPTPTALTKAQQFQIAKEFNYSETVFILSAPSLTSTVVPISIWTTEQELPFAGHPTVGTAFHLLHDHQNKLNKITLQAPAGDIHATCIRSSDTSSWISIQTPHNIKLHSKLSHSIAMSVINGLTPESFVAADNSIPTISIVSGLSFVLIQVTSLSVLSSLSPRGKAHQFSYTSDLQATLPAGFSTAPFVGTYCYVVTDDNSEDTIKLQARMFFEGDQEDAATGSAACAVGAYLTTVRGKNTAVEIVQGVEMGRRSEIGVRGEVNENRDVKNIYLEGTAVRVMEGVLTL